MASPSPIKSDVSTQDIDLLRTLVPLHSLPKESFAELMEELVIDQLNKGALLFKQGDTDHVNLYLLEGEVALLSGDRVSDKLKAGTETARFPLSPILPRRSSARAASEVRVACLDSRKISDFLSRCHSVDYQVSDLDDTDSNDWMSLLLQSRVLQQVPAGNIQRVMMSVDQVDVRAGENIIRQGDPGDFYFMLTAGHAVVQRDVEDQPSPVELAKLSPGDAFGEEALLSDSPRNSTVTMLTDGMVLRLAKDDFVGLIHNPLLHSLEIDEAREKIAQGAIWLDLRTQEEYEENHISGSINLPIESLRYQASNLAPDRHYVLCSNSGGRAVAAAFLLTERGLDVSVLAGGFNALTDEPDSIEEPPAELQDESSLQKRVQIAELRAKEMEERLQKAQDYHQTAETEKQQHLASVKDAVDKARNKILASEKEKQEALEAQYQAYSEMETLTSNMEALEGERAELADRMAEIEGLDGKLQKRLQKVERELIAERESAESASSSLEEISQRLSGAMEERDLERADHARRSGELKDQMTVLLLELEQARADIAELSKHQEMDADARFQQEREEKNEAVRLLEKQLADARGQTEKALEEQAQQLNTLVDSLQNEAIESSEVLARKDVEISRLREALLQVEKDSEEKKLEQDALISRLQVSLKEAEEKNTVLDARLAGNREHDLAKRFSELEAEQLAWQSLDQQQKDEIEVLRLQLQDTQDPSFSLEKMQGLLDAAETRLSEACAERDALLVAQQDAQVAPGQENFSASRTDKKEPGRLQAKIDALQAEIKQAAQDRQTLHSEHEDLHARYIQRQNEVTELREVMQTYVEQITNAQTGDADENESLRAELQMVREQAIKDVAQMREQLAASEQVQKVMQETGGRDALSVEAMRQEISAVQESLDERQRELGGAEETRQMLEDRLEDANTEIETLRRQVDLLAVEADESRLQRDEAESAHGQVQDALLQLQQDTEFAKTVELRDERMQLGKRPLDIEKVAGNGNFVSRLLMLSLGIGMGVALLEVLSFVAGRGEIFSSLLN